MNEEGLKNVLSAEDEREILAWAREYARVHHWTLNPDEKRLMVVIRGLARNRKKYGEKYCPCRLRSGDPEKDRDIICPCVFHGDEIKERGSCHCQLYFDTPDTGKTNTP
ncbi:MAG TPA: ferredoxin-thioredoxin reductase catalytic domain-containing protein [Methanolinea sp.]|jgi:ferredoxin-thioredoxin reductase catalytic subunit|nr:ferredoxin-thioredoxin reductase catalytic domain-containing protein [Methanolinea sp.]HPC54676.1 ferredoxin-thioredoxin reductase catalytic domain-containing protein [Methanolinea sp.]HQE85042.1 ferredoxin-thioredoxin reductase catalytic domain-containing protein [Methanolinea sp.]HQJ17971.1 ferredoxin-thioredoxin reductase catalytic domain-containing protein [Methanolinea sp.]HRS92033.1 ferredoxin-thioredoxin reductase catalytic domain-containing protein [Methanolinea sp.]